MTKNYTTTIEKYWWNEDTEIAFSVRVDNELDTIAIHIYLDATTPTERLLTIIPIIADYLKTEISKIETLYTEALHEKSLAFIKDKYMLYLS